MKRSEWNLLAISAAGGQPLTPVQLQKSLFLLEAYFPADYDDGPYESAPYDYGPFSAMVYHEAEQLALRGFVDITKTSQGWSQYAATPRGLQVASELATAAPQVPLHYLREAVTWTRSLTFQQLVRAIYDKFPAYREKSIFRY